MFRHINTDNILFLDIETVSQYPSYNEMPENLRSLWDKKASWFRKEELTPEELYSKAGIYAEFGKIICISMGIFDSKGESRKLRIKSFFGDDEYKILAEFGHLLNGLSERKTVMLCAHNGKEFDFPYIARRMLVNEIPLPYPLDISGRKPWETNFIDTMELWKFGDHKHYISLELLTTILNVANPKDDIDGSMISGIYWKDKEFESIVAYCEKDVIAIAQLILRYKGEVLLKPEDIIRITD
jgi:predicted PolB exonuclease-like 3'-5' exonuclease